MHELKFYGASDDLLEVEGAITEEFNPPIDCDDEDGEGVHVAVSDGTLLHVRYGGTGGAFWRINVVKKGRHTAVAHVAATDEDGDYTDRLTLTAEEPFEWVAMVKPGSNNVAMRGN